MGDRNNPIKFGPEWLRNLASEGHPSTSGGNNHTPMPHNSASGAGASGGGASGNTASSPSSSNASNMSPKVQLAKLRYGREEMLALYDRTSEAPPELKYIDLLYQTRGKPPFALNTFDDEMRDFARGGPPIGSMSPGERFGMSRGSPRGLSLSDTKPRLRAPFVRQPFAGRGPLWHVASPRMPGYSGGADDDSSNSRSSWSASNGGNHQNRNSGEQVEWTPNKQYRRRQGHANWRQAREEGEEWRSPDAGRSRPNQQDKWERDWGGPSQDRQSWNSNRRNWVGGDQNNEENLPEWAMENAEACGGTFDSSGAFHGYSNDDTNIPKSQDSSYPLTRSHTHGSFARSRTVEEGSEDWWASDKAKKLSPKRFDASDVKFRKQMSTPEVSAEGGIEVKPCLRKEIDKRHEVPEKESAAYEENASGGFSDDEKYVKSNAFKQNFTDSKTFEALMRSDINLEEGTDDRGNFQSVMINPNNSLRQKHQHMVPVASEMTRENMNMTNAGILHLLQNAPTSTSLENEMRKKQQQSSEDKIVEEIFDMTLDDKELLQKGKPISSPMMNHSITMCSTMASMANSMPQISSSGMQMRLSSQGYQGIPVNSKPNMPQGAHGLPVGLPSLPVGLQGGIQSGMQTMSSGYPIGLPPSIHQITGMQPMLQGGMQSAPIPGGMQPSGLQVSVNQQSVMSGSGIQTSAMQGNNMQQPQMQGGMQGPGIQGPGMQGPALSPGVQGGIPPSGMQQGGMPIQGMHGNMPPSLQGITNSALNASLGLPIGPSSNAMGVPRMGGPGLQGVMGAGGIQGNGAGMPSYPSGGLAAISSNNSLFMGQNSSNSSMGSTTDIPMPNHGSQSNMFSMNSLQHSSSQAAFNSMYSNLPPPNNPALADQWYYEDPEKNIQGPFTSKEMYNWYRAGFFGPNLLVRRACDAAMRPLGSYGPMDLMGSYPLTSGFDRSPGAHEMLNSQKGLCLDPVDSLWSQPTADMVWMQQALGQRQHNEARVNNLPLFFWEQQPSAITSNALLPEEIAKEMKTEDQILAQLRASQNISTPQSAPFANEPPTVTAAPTKSEETTPSPPNATPNMEELQKLIQKDTLVKSASETSSEPTETQPKPEKPVIKNDSPPDVKRPTQTKGTGDAKPSKQSKNENEKPTKNKENNSGKNKNKKKEEKKVETENKPKEEENVKIEKRSEEPSPPKTKKDDKQNKKDTEKEKKEWIRDGFTIVKGSEKGPGKDKKKVEEAKAVEEAERKRKDEERLAAEEEKKKKQTEQAKKQQQQQQQKQAPEAERVVKKAPWSAMNNQGMTASNKDGLSLTEIQRLEREKKLEMMKEQQQMMQLIAQQQAAALAREQEMQAGLGWAKKKTVNVPVPGQSLAEIQAEARKQAAAAVAAATAAAAAQAIEESAQPPTNTVAWSNATNGGGFWDPQPQVAEKPQELPKPAVEREVKAKKKPAVVAAAAPAKKEPSPSAKKEPSPPAKKDSTPAIEFEGWCTSVLAPWSTKIDVPTFVGFLKDIESPYEVKDYAKCYLGDSKESNDFARQFLERRSKMLRVGMVTPSDDLCSPAMAVNPRTTSGSDYQEVKGKGKKTKKNKMLKVDARILGFSVTASEDRINVGDIDTV